MKKEKLIYEGKAKRVYATSDSRLLITEFKDSLTAFNAKKRGSFEGKGEINKKITTLIFKHLEASGIPTHLVEWHPEYLVVKKLSMIPLEVVVRNVAAGSFSTRYGWPEGRTLDQPLVEFYYKKDDLNDPLMAEDHIQALGILSVSEVAKLKLLALNINILLKNLMAQVDLKLIDFKIEFGRDFDGRIILGDEISPDSCRLWDAQTGEKRDKDRFRRDLGRVEESYRLILEKLERIFKK